MRSPQLLELKVNEFRRGLTPIGTKIGFYRNEEYRLSKISQNPLAGGTVDLIRTGAFTRGLFVQNISNDTYYFDSTDEKSDKLFAEPTQFSLTSYGEINRGLNQETFNEYQTEYLLPIIRKYINKRIK